MSRPVERLANLDLNLLVTLRELIRARNVTRAAERIGVTQPAVSASLSRLRRHFGDEILVRGKSGYVLSPLAKQISEQVEEVCAAAERIFSAQTDFDPVTSEREFTLLMADHSVGIIGRRLSQLLASAAPNARLHVKLIREPLAADLSDTIRFIDGMVTPPLSRFRAADTRSVELFRDRWVCVVSADNHKVGRPELELDDLTRLSWVAPYHQEWGYPSAAPITRQLTLLGIRPKVEVRVESYQAVPHFVAGTDRIALVQERLATEFAAALDLRVLECPGEPEPIVETLWWHESYEDDPAHVWLRTLVLRAAERL
ncbi:MAG: LysR family transcriptional regulator [Sciscionella sp.]